MENHTDERLSLLRENLKEIDELKNKEFALRRVKTDVSVSKASYDTDHVKRANEKRNERMKQVEAQIAAKSSANKRTNWIITAAAIVAAAVLRILMPDSWIVYALLGVYALAMIIRLSMNSKAISKIREEAQLESNREFNEAAEKDKKENDRYSRAVKKAKEKAQEENNKEIDKVCAEIKKIEGEIADLGIVTKDEIKKNPAVFYVLMDLVDHEKYSLDDAVAKYRENQEKEAKREAERQAAREEAKKREQKAQERKKYVQSETYKGKKWDLINLNLTPDTIAQLELDAEALMYSFKHVRPSQEKDRMLNTWYCMTALESFMADMRNDEAQQAIYKGVTKKLKESGSWKLSVLAVAIDIAALSVMTGLVGISNPMYLDDAVKNSDEVREAKTNEEKEYMLTMATGCMIASGALGRFAKDIMAQATGSSSSSSSSSYSSSSSSYYDPTPSYSSPQSSVRKGSMESTHERYTYTPKPASEKKYDSSGYTSFNADKKAYIVSHPWDADLKVYFTSAWDSDIKYYIVKSAWEADVKIYPVNSAWDADIKAFRID